jgi:hypothetical protein
MKKLVLSSWMVCLCSILAVTGCEKRPELITGSVFVVTKGAGSYKMGLVPIYLLPSEKAAEMLDELARRVSSANSELQKKIEGLSADLTKLQEQDGALEKQRVALSLECDSVDAAYTAVRNAISLGSNGAPPVEVQFIFDAKGAADAEREAINTKLAEMRQQTASLESEISNLNQLLDQSQAIAVRTFFSGLEKAGGFVAAKTDADGKFDIKMPQDLDQCVLAANGTRTAGEEEEEYFWFVKPEFDSDGVAKVLLSNDSLVDSQSLEGLKAVLAKP